MRALLVTNPKATTASAQVRDVVARALSSELKLEVVETTRRSHATTLATQAADDGLDLVVALGGDGTVNEVVNGLLHAGPRPGLPALAVVPAGSTNVFARSLGMPGSPIEATSQLLDGLCRERRRSIGLGQADGRWFTFSAGLGLDAGAVRRVEAARRRGQRASQSLYVRSAVKEYWLGGARGEPTLVLEQPGVEPVALSLALVCNTDPWTYLGQRAVRPCPGASFDLGLDVFGMTKMPVTSTLRHLRQFLSPEPRPHGRQLHLVHDAAELVLRSSVPQPFQLDGDGLGDRTQVRLRSVPRALTLIM